MMKRILGKIGLLIIDYVTLLPLLVFLITTGQDKETDRLLARLKMNRG